MLGQTLSFLPARLPVLCSDDIGSSGQTLLGKRLACLFATRGLLPSALEAFSQRNKFSVCRHTQ